MKFIVRVIICYIGFVAGLVGAMLGGWSVLWLIPSALCAWGLMDVLIKSGGGNGEAKHGGCHNPPAQVGTEQNRNART